MFLPKLGTQVVISWPRQSVLKLLPNILEDWDDKATGVSEGNGDEGGRQTADSSDAVYFPHLEFSWSRTEAFFGNFVP